MSEEKEDRSLTRDEVAEFGKYLMDLRAKKKTDELQEWFAEYKGNPELSAVCKALIDDHKNAACWWLLESLMTKKNWHDEIYKLLAEFKDKATKELEEQNND